MVHNGRIRRPLGELAAVFQTDDMKITQQTDRTPAIEGLSYVSEFISEDTASYLLKQIDQERWSADLKRRVQHYGYRYDYKVRSVSMEDRLGPLPSWLDQFISHHLHNSVLTERPDQVIVNEYLPGQGISAHVDCIPCFGDTIASLSLASATTMTFFGPTGERNNLYLQPGSLLVLTGEARSKWRHAIPARKSDMIDGQRRKRRRRVSLTFRKVLQN